MTNLKMLKFVTMPKLENSPVLSRRQKADQSFRGAEGTGSGPELSPHRPEVGEERRRA